ARVSNPGPGRTVDTISHIRQGAHRGYPQAGGTEARNVRVSPAVQALRADSRSAPNPTCYSNTVVNKPGPRQHRAGLLAQVVCLLLGGGASAANAAVDVIPSFEAGDPTSYTPGDAASFPLTISNDGADDTAVAEIELDAYAGASGTTAASGIT